MYGLYTIQSTCLSGRRRTVCMVLHDRKFELFCHLSDKDNSLHQLPFTSELYNYATSNSVTISPSMAVKDLRIIVCSDLEWYRHIRLSTMVGNATKMSAWVLSLFQNPRPLQSYYAYTLQFHGSLPT